MCLNGLLTLLEEPDMTNINAAGISLARNQGLACAQEKKAKGKRSEVGANQNLSAIATIRYLFN
jgi:hypothetical protein